MFGTKQSRQEPDRSAASAPAPDAAPPAKAGQPTAGQATSGAPGAIPGAQDPAAAASPAATQPPSQPDAGADPAPAAPPLVDPQPVDQRLLSQVAAAARAEERAGHFSAAGALSAMEVSLAQLRMQASDLAAQCPEHAELFERIQVVI